MDIRLLRYFLAVAREENITRAAETLHISQPSLSKQLAELERELGKPLLIRGRRKLALTQEGILFRRRAEEIVALFEKTERELRTDTAQICGEIAIGGNPTETVLRAAASLCGRHSGIRFRFYSGDAIDVLERLDHGSLDFAVFLEPIDAAKYAFLSLPDVSRWGLLMPDTCPMAAQSGVSKADLASVPLIFHRRAGLQRLIAHWADTDPEQLNISATYNVINGSPAKFVKSGLGCFLTTEDLLPSPPEKGLCFRPLEPPLPIRYALIWKHNCVFSQPARLFLSELTALCGAA